MLEHLDYIPSEVDIWGALVQPYDMGKEYSTFFSDFFETSCKLCYVNTNRSRYIQGYLPPLCCQNGRHPQAGFSDRAPYQSVPDIFGSDPFSAVFAQKRVWTN